VLVFGVAGRLGPPRDWQVGLGADDGVQLVAVESATLEGGDRGEVRPVDGQVRPEVRDGLTEPGQDMIKAVRQRRTVLPQLDRELYAAWMLGATPSASCRAACSPTSRTVRDHVHALDEREPNHRPDRITRPTRPAGLLKIADQTRDLRAVEQRAICTAPRHGGTFRTTIEVTSSWSRPPDVGASRGSPIITLSCP
jgi:hypothetical protein